jgi:hypothetical protein
VKTPVILRHNRSGVWIGYLLGPAEGPLGHVGFAFEGRRIWNWQGGRLECSQLATQGVSESDRLGDWVAATIAFAEFIEAIECEGLLVERARKLPRCL